MALLMRSGIITTSKAQCRVEPLKLLTQMEQSRLVLPRESNIFQSLEQEVQQQYRPLAQPRQRPPQLVPLVLRFPERDFSMSSMAVRQMGASLVLAHGTRVALVLRSRPQQAVSLMVLS